MKRISIALVALMAAAGVLAACSNDGHAAGEHSGGQGADNGHPDDGHHDDGHHHGDHGDPSPVADGARTIAVTANDMSFDPDEITVAAGEDIAIELTSEDILHDFVIDEFDAHVAADAGETDTGGFTAGDVGQYPFYCAVAGHREAGMEGTLIVTD